MPGKKIYSKRYTAKPKTKDKQQDKQISKLKKKVSLITKQIEDKYIGNVILNQNIIQTAPYTYCLNVLQQGTSLTTRLGNEVYMKYLRLKMYLYNTANAFSYDNMIRIVIVREVPQLGSAISLNSLFGVANPYPYTLYENQNRDFKHRFKIVYDRTYNLWDNNNLFQRVITINKKLGFTTNYARGNAGTVADIDTNGLHLVVFSQKGTVGVTYITYEYEITFEDA